MKFLDSKTHAIIDYVLDLVFVIAPTAFGFSAVASTICYVVAGAHFLTSICTQYEYSLVKLIPFPIHGGIEFAAAMALVLMPWLADFAGELAARNFFVGTGVAVFAVWAITNYGSSAAIGVLDKDRSEELTYRKVS